MSLIYEFYYIKMQLLFILLNDTIEVIFLFNISLYDITDN